MPSRDIVVIGASSGGIQALKELVAGLPVDIPAAFFVVVHTSATHSTILAELLARSGRLAAETAVNGAPIHQGRIYVAQGDHHLLVEPGRMRVVRGPKQNGFRPAIDPLFRSAAKAYGERVTGVVLSGALDDGTLGLDCIKRAGGRAVVQDPTDAMVDSMPVSAIRNVNVDHVSPAADMGPLLSRLVREPLANGERSMARPTGGKDQAEMQPDALETGRLEGPPSPYTCPECGGSLWESRTGKLVAFNCHTGHGFTAESLVAAQTGALEEALWSALRALEEHAALQRRMADRARQGGLAALGEQYDARVRTAEERSALIRQALLREEGNERIGQQPL
jgi:two-component system chemotaxis response regulator CheB